MLLGLLIMMVAVILAGSSKWASPTSGPEAPSSESAPRHLQIAALDMSSLPGQPECLQNNLQDYKNETG